MTHAYFQFDREISWDDCRVVRFPSNNCILLQDKRENCIILIQGEDVGISKTDPDNLAIYRATPVLKMTLNLRNEAFNRGVRWGHRERLSKIKQALEL